MRLHRLRDSVQHSRDREEARLLRKTHEAIRPGGSFIIYQVTNELRQHATLFDHAKSEYFLQNIPPMFITVFTKASMRNGHSHSVDPGSADSRQSTGMTVRASRTEKDSMGEMSVPETALYGASTQRAVLNFPVSGYRFTRPFIRALGLIKWAAAQANHDLGLLDAHRCALIVQAAEEVVEGKLDEHFPLDIFQTGSGTSTNTNANEVISNRSCQLDGKAIGARDPVHPNDHVNMGQSSNDVIPSAIHVSAAEELKNNLLPALERLQTELDAKAKEFWDIIKIGRTHLMDATPVRLGQGFGGYAQQIAYARERAERAIDVLRELALGGTAVGTGLNRHPDFPAKVMRHLQQRTGIEFREATNHFEAQGGEGCGRGSERSPEDDRGQPLQDRERHSLARQRPALRHRRDPITRDAARQLDHARQSEPGHVGVDDDGLLAGDRERQLHHLGGRERELRAQRHDAGDGAQHSREHPPARERVRHVRRESASAGSWRTKSVAASWSSFRWRW